jgi:zinc transport system ATP-binding protein
MISKPALLLLDEPTANLDLTLEDKLLETLLQFHPGMKIIMVSHDLGFVSGAVKQVLCVNKHVHTHPTESISAELIEELYGSSPRRILHSADLGHDHHHH